VRRQITIGNIPMPRILNKGIAASAFDSTSWVRYIGNLLHGG